VLAGGIGGALAGLTAGRLGALLDDGARAAAGTLAALVLAVAPLIPNARPPQLNRETEQSLLGRGPITWALTNGLLLGLGFTSRIGYWIWYLLPLGCFILASPAFGALAWGAYGLTRLGIAAAAAARMQAHPRRMALISRHLLGLRDPVRSTANLIAASLAATLALWIGL
jgi:hypothetical protein